MDLWHYGNFENRQFRPPVLISGPNVSRRCISFPALVSGATISPMVSGFSDVYCSEILVLVLRPFGILCRVNWMLVGLYLECSMSYIPIEAVARGIIMISSAPYLEKR